MLLPLLINLKMVGSDPNQGNGSQSSEVVFSGGGLDKRAERNKQNQEEEAILIEILKFWSKWQN